MISVSNLDQIALESESAVDFYLSAYQEYGEDLKEFFIDNDTNYKSYYQNAIKDKRSEQSEWKPPVGSIDDWSNLGSITIKIPRYEVIPISNSSASARAWRLGVIEVNRDNDFSKLVFDHEIGHQLTNGNSDLQQAVIMNYGNALGRYNLKSYKFDGAMGEYSPEEAWATCYSYYINYPDHLKRIFPLAFTAVSNALKSITNLEEIQNGFYSAYEECFNEKITDQLN